MRLLAILPLLLAALLAQEAPPAEATDGREVREVLSDLVLGKGGEEANLARLGEFGDPLIEEVVAAWRIGGVLVAPGAPPDGEIVLLKRDGGVVELLSGQPYAGSPGEAKVNRAGRSLRRKLSRIVDVLELASPDPGFRADAAMKLGSGQNPDFLAELQARLPKQKQAGVRRAFEEAINISLLANGTEMQKLAAVEWLGDHDSVAGRDFIRKLRDNLEDEAGDEAAMIRKAADEALDKIASYEKAVEIKGTLFRGLSTGSVLLVVSYGLAITFGLMGVINMAHGEFIAIGAYTVYVVQNIFAAQFGAGSDGFENYFLVSLPCAFLVAALFGVLLERGVIRFLYKRPLESLLATWGISMIIQQLLRLQFGAANVQVASPEWLSGGFEFSGVSITYNRLFLIVFAGVVILMTWLLLRRTPLGLQIRATMQNRAMASSLGIASNRVNMLTFGFGSGLAGLAGAFLSQIGNVGPSMGQAYIVDSFMVVVIGGVGNLLGAALSSLGIGMVDQSLQPVLGPVMGKICVLIAIILFLQWRPGGLFPSRSRSLDD